MIPSILQSESQNSRNQQFIFQQENSRISALFAAKLKDLKTENGILKARNSSLEEANDTLANNLEQEVTAAVHNASEHRDTLEKLKTLENSFDEMKSKLRSIKNEKKHIEDKNVKTCDEIKALRADNDDLKKENKKVNIALVATRKDLKENNSRSEKVIKKDEDTIKELLSYKLVNTSEEKFLKNMQKKLNKKLKVLEKREVKNDVYDNDLDLNENEPNS